MADQALATVTPLVALAKRDNNLDIVATLDADDEAKLFAVIIDYGPRTVDLRWIHDGWLETVSMDRLSLLNMCRASGTWFWTLNG